MIKRSVKGTALALALFGAAACGGGEGGGPSPAEMAQGADGEGSRTLTGAGATFPYPIYSRWFDEYSRSNGVRVNYQSIGSGGGIRQLSEGTVDFGASDAPMNQEEMADAPGTLHIPTVVGTVAVTYNLPGLAQPLRLTGPVLGDIFAGTIRKWNDPRISQLNPGVALPDRDILVVHRTDGSGTTYVFTEYLAAVSPSWAQGPGKGKQVSWPTGLGAKGNEGIAGQVKQTEGAIGYVEDVYATQNQLATAAIQNRSGEFVTPTLESAAAAADGVAAGAASDAMLTASLVDAEGAGAYPITTWTYLLVPPTIEDCAKANTLVPLVRWMLTEGDATARELGYSPLPASVEAQALQKLGTVTCGPNRQPVAGAA